MRITGFPTSYDKDTKFKLLTVVSMLTVGFVLSIALCFIVCVLLETLNGWTFISR